MEFEVGRGCFKGDKGNTKQIRGLKQVLQSFTEWRFEVKGFENGLYVSLVRFMKCWVALKMNIPEPPSPGKEKKNKEKDLIVS